MLYTVLVIIALVLALVAQFSSRGRSLIAWAVIALAAALLLGSDLPSL